MEQVRRVQRGVRGLVDRFMGQLQALEALGSASDRDRDGLAARMKDARAALLEDYWRVERQSAELGRLYAASCHLHGATGPEGVLESIRSVVAELLGCSRLAVYHVEEGGRGLALTAAWGVAGELPPRPPIGSGPLGESVAAGSPWVLDSPPSPVYMGGAPLWAVVPLFGGGRVGGALALLEQPAPSVDPQHAFELLAIHGGGALENVRLSRRAHALMAV